MRGVLLALIFALISTRAVAYDPVSERQSMTIRMVGDSLQATGTIDQNAYFRLRDIVETHDFRGKTIYFHSDGGAVMPGMMMGQLIRQAGMNTGVGEVSADGHVEPGACESMCPFVLMAGKKKFITEKDLVSIHQLYRSGEDTRNAKVTNLDIHFLMMDLSRVMTYIRRIHGSNRLLEIALFTPPWKNLHKLTRAELRRVGMPITSRP